MSDRPPIALAQPHSTAAHAGERLGREIDARISALAATARRVATGGDPEAVHDLRVASRRAHVFLWLWQEALPRAARTRAASALRCIRRVTGEARDWQVSVSLLADAGERLGPAARVSGEALAARVCRRLARSETRRARRAWRRGADDAGRAFARATRRLATRVENDDAHARAALSRLAQARGRALDALATAARDGADDDALHQARVRLKRWRYAAESLSVTGLAEDGAPIVLLREAQQHLGAVRDLVILRGVADARAEKWRALGLTRRAEALDELRSMLATEERAARERAAGAAERLLRTQPAAASPAAPSASREG